MILLWSTGAQARVLTYAPHIIPVFLFFWFQLRREDSGTCFFFFCKRHSGWDFFPTPHPLSQYFFLTDEDVFFICIKETLQRSSFSYSHYFFLSAEDIFFICNTFQIFNFQIFVSFKPTVDSLSASYWYTNNNTAHRPYDAYCKLRRWMYT